MSIVYDYLKQIRDQKETKTVVPSSEALSVKKDPGSFLWAKITAGILACLVLVAGVYFFLSWAAEKTTIPAMSQKIPSAPVQTPDFNFLLEGIIYNPSQPFAIIDGKMYERGGKFGDFEVGEITSDTVVLKDIKNNTSRLIRL